MSFLKRVIRNIIVNLINYFIILFNSPIKLSLKKYKFIFKNLEIKINTNDEIVFRRWKAFERNGKERDTIQWIDEFEDNKVFYDIGANVGIFSIYASLKKKVKVYSFEPEPNSFIELTKAIDLNQLNISPILIGLGSESKPGYFNMSSNQAGLSNHQISQKNIGKKNFILSVQTIDNLIQEQIISIPNYIKIDVDGNEKEILKGMEHTLNNNELKSILVEIDNQNNFKFIYDYLNNFGFKINKEVDQNTKNYIFEK